MARYDLHGKVSLVTGAARGIGRATAQLLHDRGGSVAIVDLDAEDTGRAATAVGERALAIAADVTDAEALEAAVTQTVERFGGLDVVVANAGVAPPVASIRTIDQAAFERTVEIDLLGVWRTVRPALPHVIDARGQVVVISSVYAWVNGGLAASYATSKAGVEAFGRALRAELAPTGASATVAHFGFIDTQMVRESFSDPVAHDMEQMFPAWARRRLTPEQAAAAIGAGLERRAQRVIAPGWQKVWFYLRGIVNPVMDAAMARNERTLELLRRGDRDDRAELEGGLARVRERAGR